MARIRTIKPEFFTSLTVASLPLTARLTFIGLWTHVDDEGRCVDDARLVKAAVWPLDDRTAADVEADLVVLTEASLIARYIVSERSYLAVTGWDEHQKINRPTKSKLPAPIFADVRGDNGNAETRNVPPPAKTLPHPQLTEESVSTHAPLTQPSLAERKGKEQGTGNRELLLSPPGGENEAWNEFWATYPRKAAKAAAHKAWVRAIRDGADPAVIISGARRYAAARRGQDPAYTSHPATWINGQRWSDQPEPQRPGPGQPSNIFHDQYATNPFADMDEAR